MDRIKSCPCCRTEIHHRPIPLFLVKDIITAIDPSKQKLGLNISTDDPWSGIFPDENDDEEYEYDSSDTEYDLTEGEEEEGEEEGIKSEPSLSLVVTGLEGGRGSLDTRAFGSTAIMRTCSTSIIEK